MGDRTGLSLKDTAGLKRLAISVVELPDPSPAGPLCNTFSEALYCNRITDRLGPI